MGVMDTFPGLTTSPSQTSKNEGTPVWVIILVVFVLLLLLGGGAYMATRASS
jgi:flagellar basal body-associated protein FliL